MYHAYINMHECLLKRKQKCLLAPFEAIHSILPTANLLAHNNISQICYYSQISLQNGAAFLTI